MRKLQHFGRMILAALAWVGMGASTAAQAQEQQPGERRYALCDLENRPAQRSYDIDDLKGGFTATGYIATIACAPDAVDSDNEASHQLAGNYTRWVVEPADVFLNDGQRVYSIEGRSWIQRLFTDRVIDTAHFLEITLAAPDVVFSIPLSTFKYNEEGENGIEYTTSFRQHAFNQTHFRVDTNTTSNIVARGKHSFRTSFSGAVDALNAVQNVVQLVAPSSTLLTSINAEQVTNTSNAINTVATSLFSNRFDETIADGFSFADWHPDRKVLVIIQLPWEVTSHRRNPNGRSNNKEAIYLSYWLSLACPRESIFNTVDVCGNGQPFAATTGSILNFKMAANKTVKQHLDDQQWYKDFLTSPIFTEERNSDPESGNGEARDDLIERFCRSIENEFYSVGFNSADTTQIVRAAIVGMPELSPVTGELGDRCAVQTFQSRGFISPVNTP